MKNFAHFRQFNKGKKHSVKNGGETLSEKSNSVKPQDGHSIKMRKGNPRVTVGDTSMMGSTAA